MDDGPNININVSEIKKRLGKFSRTVFIGAILLVVVIIALNSYYILQSGEEAVIIRLGSHVATVVTPGLHFKLPIIDEANKVSTQLIRYLNFGYRTEDGSKIDITSPELDREAIMLTGDENLVVADWTIQYRIQDPFLAQYKIEDLENTIRILSESSYRRVVASNPLDNILTDQKASIQTAVLLDLQGLCDKYETGVQIKEVLLQDAFPPDAVKPAFLDVVSARENREARRNEADQYSNEKIPIAEGNAARIKNEAHAYSERRINEAKGDVARYEAIQAEYANNQKIMRTRLYLEMIKEVLPQIKSVTIVDDSNGTLKFLPIGGDGGGGRQDALLGDSLTEVQR